MSNYIIQGETLTDIADAIRAKTGSNESITAADMADAITAIPSGGSGEFPTVSVGNGQQYAFAGAGRDYVMKHYGDKFITTAFTQLANAFFNCDATDLSKLTLNIGTATVNASSMFKGCSQLEKFPVINGKIKSQYISNLLEGCYRIKNADYLLNKIDFDVLHANTQQWNSCSDIFGYCASLRSVSETILNNLWIKSVSGYTSVVSKGMFRNCYTIDEILGLNPLDPNLTFTTNNCFMSCFESCYRLKRLTFMLENNQPMVRNWGKQEINLVTVGYDNYYNDDSIIGYNSGITADKKVSDATSYEALKNDPDWYTTNINYSRYNHDSAVETINSLPDTSAVSSPSAPTNKIIFKGAAGTNTDGGAINTLTAEEIAVATNKGWSVELR